MKKKNLIAAFGILLLLVGSAVWFCGFYYRKSNDNLPTFATIEEFSFGEFKNLNFSFLSGAGGWSTELIIAEDGNFKGVYHDSDMGAGSEEYPNGTQYYCAFQGKFTQPIKKEDYI